MNVLELDALVSQINNYRGYTLTNVLFDLNVVQLSLSQDSDFRWLTASLKPGVPYAFFGDKKTTLILGLKKPLVLFIKTHFKGRQLVSAERVVASGRVLRLHFNSPEPLFIEISLFSGGQNIEAFAGEKKMSALKPKNLLPKALVSDGHQICRDPQVFREQWEERGGVPRSHSHLEGAEKDIQKALKKKRQGLEKMEAKLSQGTSDLWSAYGDWLKENPSMENPPETFRELIDMEQTYSWNLENCYARIKKLRAKREGTRGRVQALKNEIEKLESGEIQKKAKSETLFHQVDAKGKTHVLANGWRVLIGKSAQDNLALLRRAKAWYVWMHIRDFPGAYGIIERPRKAGLPTLEVIQDAAVQVAKRSVKGDRSGTFEVIYTECRYVRPIPKAKAGQVTYSHEKVVGVLL